MAKLNARGRTEVARLSHEVSLTPEEVAAKGSLVDWRRYTLVLASDGTILQKVQVRFVANGFSQAYKHDYGWKVHGKLKAGVTSQQWVDAKVARGWQLAEGLNALVGGEAV